MNWLIFACHFAFYTHSFQLIAKIQHSPFAAAVVDVFSGGAPQKLHKFIHK
jgi:hypothetical protein